MSVESASSLTANSYGSTPLSKTAPVDASEGFRSIGLSGTSITAVPLESTNSRTESLLLEKCAQV
jgi:hypothetical protein